MKQKVEYICGCNRSYIFFTDPNRPQKCPKCARIMKVVEPVEEVLQTEPAPAQEIAKEEETIHIPKSSPIGSMSHLEETWEYQYKQDPRGRGFRQESFTIGRFLKKVWMLFSFGKTSRRF